jgi:dihydrofolate reductase
MGKLTYGMGGVSLDGYISGPGGEFDWGVPDEELHRFHNERVHRLGAHLLGRRLYEVMLTWEKDDDWATDYQREFARIWRRLPKVVFSTTLESVEGNARLATSDVAEEVAALKQQSDGDLAVGGAELAAAMSRLGLIDEYELFVYPTVVGGGSPFFGGTERFDLELIETRVFGGRVVYLRYRRM